MRAALLGWYDRQGRTLPWRVRPEDRAKGIKPDPYAIWLSEIMLQQTTIAHGTPYWHKFLAEFPTVTDLANANRDRVLTLWAGLGYYARARNLHKCAGMIRDEYGGAFPKTEAELLKLPGIGPYTAATIAAICFNEPTNIVDGNVERVIARIFRVQNPLPKSKSEIKTLAAPLADVGRPGDYGQALMDLGAMICTPMSPSCSICVWQPYCAGFKNGDLLEYPKKSKKKKLPIRYGTVFVLTHDNQVLLERRPDDGLLGGMMGFPGTKWGEKTKAPLSFAPIKAKWQKSKLSVRHVFTHFELRLDVYHASIDKKPDGHWVSMSDIDNHALPTVMKKVLKAAL